MGIILIVKEGDYLVFIYVKIWINIKNIIVFIFIIEKMLYMVIFYIVVVYLFFFMVSIDYLN